MNRLVRCVSGTAVALALTAGAQAADLKVGLSVSLSGPNSSLGIPYAKGMQAAVAYRPAARASSAEADRWSADPSHPARIARAATPLHACARPARRGRAVGGRPVISAASGVTFTRSVPGPRRRGPRVQPVAW